MQRILLALYVIATSLALVSLKWGTRHGAPINRADGRLQLNLDFFVVSGIILYGISFLVYTYLISKYDLGYIVPLTTGLVYVIIFTSSYLIFNELFTALKVVGIILIASGLIVLNLK